MKQYVILILAFCLCSIGQIKADDKINTQEDFIILTGKVLDSKTRVPLYFASVNLENTNISNVTNSEGIFSLKISLKTSSESKILISHLGYSTFSAYITQFKNSSLNNPLIIEMVSVPLKLDPASIREEDPIALFDQAYNKIKNNYPQESIGMTAFYREVIKKGSKFLSLNEAILDIDKAPYNAFSSDKVGIYKGRGSVNYDSSDTLFIYYKGGAMSSLQIDLIKNPFAGVYLESVHRYYKFKMGKSVTIDDKIFYVVEFNQNEEAENELLYRGKIYIESESLAIGRLEFAMNVEGNDEAVNIFVPKRPHNLNVKVEVANYIVNFKEYNGLWYYDSAKMEVEFSTRRKMAIFRNYYNIVSEIAITDHKKGEFKINPECRIKYKDIMSEKITSFTDEDFWENYNIIEPDPTIDNIINKIVKQLSKYLLKGFKTFEEINNKNK
jgi:hypothetical protein